MKAHILSIDGKKLKQIDVPEFFKASVRNDVIQRVTELMKRKQPYSPNPLAGNMYSASGKLKHHRHVWKSQYGRGMSRVPRKTMSRRGSNFAWIGATVPNTRGGRRAHPPKIISMIDGGKINKKELEMAIVSALSATASEKWITKKYSSLEGEKINELPILVESKIAELKTKELILAMKKILGEKLFSVALQKKEIRSGRGKLRGRRYKKNAGLLIVLGEKEKLKAGTFESANVKTLSVEELAGGAPGRLTVYTENAVEELNKKYGRNKK